MFCNQRSLLQRLVVEDPAVLDTAPWRLHLQGCEECRRERYTLQRSLGVFRQFESQLPPGGLPVPSWERFSQTLARQRHWGLGNLRFRAPLAAASLLVAVGSGVLFWPVAQDRELPVAGLFVTEQAPQASPTGPAAARDVVAQDVVARASSVPARFTVRSFQPQGADAVATPLDDSAALASNAADGEQRVVFSGQGSAEAPTLLFSALQGRRSRHGPIQVLPVFAPAHRDPGSLLPRALLTPLPIR